jgi:hypothetical protein
MAAGLGTLYPLRLLRITDRAQDNPTFLVSHPTSVLQEEQQKRGSAFRRVARAASADAVRLDAAAAAHRLRHDVVDALGFPSDAAIRARVAPKDTGPARF